MVLLDTRGRQPLPLSSLNHISRNCTDINASVAFYVVSFQLTGSVPLSFRLLIMCRIGENAIYWSQKILPHQGICMIPVDVLMGFLKHQIKGPACWIPNMETNDRLQSCT